MLRQLGEECPLALGQLAGPEQPVEPWQPVGPWQSAAPSFAFATGQPPVLRQGMLNVDNDLSQAIKIGIIGAHKGQTASAKESLFRARQQAVAKTSKEPAHVCYKCRLSD